MATLDQATKILEVFKGTPTEQIQDILSSGLLADLRDANIGIIDRSTYRKMCGLPPKEFLTWKIINIGTGFKNADDFREAIKTEGHDISDWANDIIGKPAFSVSADEKKEIELVRVTVAELGFKNGATLKNIYARANELGLDLCPNEVGPQLRLQYKDQPKGERIRIAMDPIKDSGGVPDVFDVARGVGGESWLDTTRYDNPGNVWNSDGVWVFARRK